MFNQTIIDQLAETLNGRFTHNVLTALGSLSRLLINRRVGNMDISLEDFNSLLHLRIEECFPVPNLHVTVDEGAKSVSIDGHTCTVPDHSGTHLIYHHAPAWQVVVKGEDGYHLIASEDRYAIPHGKSSIPFTLPTDRNAVTQGNLIIAQGQVVWIIDSWRGAGKVLALPGEFNTNFTRLPIPSAPAPEVILSKDKLSSVVISAGVLGECGVGSVGPHTSAEVLLSRLADAETKAAESEMDEETAKLMARIHSELNFDGLLAALKTLPAKRRTRKEIRNAMALYLSQDK